MEHLLSLVICTLLLVKSAEGFAVPIAYVQSTAQKGAVWLDGSPPAYHFDKGFDAGIDNYFYNWNRIKVRYRDGSSFTSYVEAVDSATNLHYRGGRIFVVVIEDLLAKGIKNAKNTILSRCPAGELTSILQCDRFRTLLPAAAKVKCVSNAGHFIDVKAVSRAQHIEQFYSQVVQTHASTKNLPSSCTSRLSPGLCFFPAKYGRTNQITALHCAASGGSVNVVDAVRLLITAGAHISCVDADGNLPFDVIVVPPKLQRIKAVLEELLLDNGSDNRSVDAVPSAVPSSMEPLAVEKRTGINNSPQFLVTKLLTNLDRSNTRVHPKPSNVKKPNARNHTEKHNVNNGSSTSSALQKSTTGFVSKPERSSGTSNLQHKDNYHPWKMIEFYCK
ncbi:hypothetical protein KIW84_015144 [Lathyrus oleraceus]|uniref:Pectin acetylesterase n=1 Tax=Pisum sativum TaxID=3888 RepID=A0A9D5BPZ2_PEA|nr:hypothetical protein KIW84_015144 [Pisum sativum]